MESTNVAVALLVVAAVMPTAAVDEIVTWKYKFPEVDAGTEVIVAETVPDVRFVVGAE
jgi:hypothetical protein